MPNLNAAFIGCGMIAAEHLNALALLDGMRAAAYCDTDMARAGLLLDRYGGEYATDDPERIFADGSIDAVYICTHHDTHAPLSVRACNAGKHVMLEKPMALSLEDCMVIGEAVEQTGVRLMTAFKLRYAPMVDRARGFIPEPLMTMAQLTDARWDDGFWAQQPVIGGGNVLSQGVHAFDMLCHLSGAEPRTIHAEGGSLTHPDGGMIDTVAATVRFANGSIGSIVVGDCGATPYVSKFSFQILDGLKSVHLHDRMKSATFFDGEVARTEHDDEEPGMIEENRAFIRSLRTNTPVPSGWRDGLRATTMALKAFEAIRTGRAQEW